MSSRLHLWAVVLAGLLSASPIASGADRPVPLSKRGVDRLTPSRGPAILGAVFRKTQRGEVVMSVRRDWLKTEDPERLQLADASLAESSPRAWRRLLGRIDDWKKTLKPDSPLRAVLDLERKRVADLLKAVEGGGRVPATRFLALVIPRKEISALTVQPVVRKQVALVSWVEGLKRVETRSVDDLAAELMTAGLDPATAGAESLWRELPVVEDDDRTWRIRRVLKACQLSEPLHFQGTGGLLLAANEKKRGGGLDQPVDAKMIGDLVGQLLGGDLGGDLGKLLEQLGGRAKPRGGDSSPLLTAARRAEAAGRDAFRVTRFRHDVTGRRTTVTSEFLVKVDRGEWVLAWQESRTIEVRARPDARKRIERDPRVQGVLKLVKALGLDGGDRAIETAIQFGAATQEGQQRLDSGFLKFRDRYGHRLDSPPLWWGRTLRTTDDRSGRKPDGNG